MPYGFDDGMQVKTTNRGRREVEEMPLGTSALSLYGRGRGP